MEFYELQKPLYSWYSYRGEFGKIVKFHRKNYAPQLRPKKPKQEYDDKLIQSVSRSRSVVLQYALCNHWDWFFTGTIDGSKLNRFNLDNFAARLSQSIRDWRKAYKTPLSYLFVPEQHKRGGWHIHGFLAGLPDETIGQFIPGQHPQRLIDGHYLNWTLYSNKFGYCSLGHIKDPIKCGFYATKYISKSLAENIRGKGSHLYYASNGLQKAVHTGDCYVYSHRLDDMLSADYDFCSTGYCNMPWSDLLDYFDGPVCDSPFAQREVETITIPSAVTPVVCEEWQQMQIDLEAMTS